MATQPAAVAEFLAARRIVVAGVSRSGQAPANAILRRLRDAGHDVVPVNPKAAAVEGAACFASNAEVPGEIEALMVVTHPDAAPGVVRDALARGVRRAADLVPPLGRRRQRFGRGRDRVPGRRRRADRRRVSADVRCADRSFPPRDARLPRPRRPGADLSSF